MKDDRIKYWFEEHSLGRQKMLLHFCRYQDFTITEDEFEQHNINCPQHITRSVNKRRLEYFAGRLCARKALASLGVQVQVDSGTKREPVWPKSIIGSISHSHNLAVAIVKPDFDTNALGIDVEGVVKPELQNEIISQVISPTELRLIGRNLSELEFTRVFSAKESYFKAAFRFVNDYFGFEALTLQYIKKHKMGFKISKTLHAYLPRGTDVEVHTLYLTPNLVLSLCILDSLGENEKY